MVDANLSVEEIAFVKWYRQLPTLERCAVNCWLRTGDPRLIFPLWDRLFVDTSDFRAVSADPHKFLKIPVTVRPD